MTVATAVENSTSEPCEEPPTKKQKVEGGAAVATATADDTELSTENVMKTGGRPKKRKRSKSKSEFKIPCNEMPHFKSKNYKCLLLNYMRKIRGVKNPKLEFKTEEDTEIKLPNCKYYVSTCSIDGLIGKGRASTMKKSRQQACLYIIQGQNLVPRKTFVDTMAVTLPPPPPKVVKPIKPIIEYNSYLQGNYKGALEEYLAKNMLGQTVIENTECVHIKGNEWEHQTSCSASGRKGEGCGKHKHKKKSIQLAYLNLILDMKLISKEQHLEKHPPASKSETEKSLLSAPVNDQLSEKKKSLCDASSELTAQVVNQNVEKSKESAVEQNVDEPSKKLEQANQNVDEPSIDEEKQKEDAPVQSTVTANGKFGNVNEKQTADEVSKMEEETEATT